MDNPKVEVIIVGYNTPELERYTLSAVAQNTVWPNLQVKHSYRPESSLRATSADGS